ncbi:MAG: 50S ribosomal protein L16 [Patescibacteria group bacterium]
MLFPKKVKYRKQQKGRTNPAKKRIATRGTVLAFGSFGLKAQEPKWLSAQQLEAARKVMVRYTRKSGKIWIRVFPDKIITKKPPEVGMGKGKGTPEGFAAPVEPGRVIFEMDGIPEAMAKEALRKAGDKLPIKTKFIKR